MRYETEKELLSVVEAFEAATISREAWKHAEHLTVALVYADRHDLETATERMRSGIFKLLAAFGVDLTKEMPYHETLTVFWMLAVAAFNSSRAGSTLLDRANELAASYDKDHPLKFYSRERLFSDEARAAFVEPDIITDLSKVAET